MRLISFQFFNMLFDFFKIVLNWTIFNNLHLHKIYYILYERRREVSPTGRNFSTYLDLMPGVLKLHNVFFVYIRIQDKTLNIAIEKVLIIS